MMGCLFPSPKNSPQKLYSSVAKSLFQTFGKLDILKDTTTFTLPEPCSPPAAGSMAREARGWSPQKPSRAWKETPNPQFPWCTCVFLFKLNPLLAVCQVKVRKKPIKCLSHSFYFKGWDIKLFTEQLLSGMRIADESRQKSPIGKEDCRKTGFLDTAAEGNTTTLQWNDTTKYLDPYPEVPLSTSSSSEDGAQGMPTRRSCSTITGASRPEFPHPPPPIKKPKAEVSITVQCLQPHLFFPQGDW